MVRILKLLESTVKTKGLVKFKQLGDLRARFSADFFGFFLRGCFFLAGFLGFSFRGCFLLAGFFGFLFVGFLFFTAICASWTRTAA